MKLVLIILAILCCGSSYAYIEQDHQKIKREILYKTYFPVECDSVFCKEYNDLIKTPEKDRTDSFESILKEKVIKLEEVDYETNDKINKERELFNEKIGLMLVLILVYTALVGFLLFRYFKFYFKYKPIVDIQNETQRKKEQLNTVNQELQVNRLELENISKQLVLLHGDLDVLEAGFYDNKYNFYTTYVFKIKIEEIRKEQKQMIKDKKAIVCSAEWTVGGSKAEGKKMTDRIIKLGLSAFNVQCDNEILNVSYNNVNKSEEKIEKIKENINKLLEPNHCSITSGFFQLKLQELFLVYEYQEKLQNEKEEQRLIREQMKEEEKALREAEKAQEEAEKEEKIYQKALDKAKEALSKQKEENKAEYLEKISELEHKLKEAQYLKERAKSQAELTKQGHVYVISNIGSFGENVYKIGMTRRLDPMDRVKELGDASVPFSFDVHAMIFCENAPLLERQLHLHFNNKRLNQINERKEFFKVSLEEIEEACKSFYKNEFKLTKVAEAKDYYMTLAKMRKN